MKMADSTGMPVASPWRAARAGVLLAAAAAGGVSAHVTQPVAAADEQHFPYVGFNGFRIYLSPARHTDTGQRGECGLDENENAYRAARAAAITPSGSNQPLTGRGYKVQIGRGTLATAIANSDAWGADLHIPIHSNARPEAVCSNTNAAQHGTVVIHKDGSGASSALSANLRDWIGAASPGTNDFKCANADPCTAIKSLAELNQPRALPAYVEQEFHTWKTGANWMVDAAPFGWRYGAAVDTYLGYPR